MTAHERCIKELQRLLRESARRIEELADRLPEAVSDYPLEKFFIELKLMNDGITYNRPFISLNSSSFVPFFDDAKDKDNKG